MVVLHISHTLFKLVNLDSREKISTRWSAVTTASADLANQQMASCIIRHNHSNESCMCVFVCVTVCCNQQTLLRHEIWFIAILKGQ